MRTPQPRRLSLTLPMATSALLHKLSTDSRYHHVPPKMRMDLLYTEVTWCLAVFTFGRVETFVTSGTSTLMVSALFWQLGNAFL